MLILPIIKDSVLPIVDLQYLGHWAFFLQHFFKSDLLITTHHNKTL